MGRTENLSIHTPDRTGDISPVAFLRDKYAILITARPQKYREATLERIKLLTDWQPQEAYFAEISAPPPEIKEHLLLNYIFPKHGRNGEDYFGIESNPKTRAMYLRYGIKSLRAEDFKKQTVDKFGLT